MIHEVEDTSRITTEENEFYRSILEAFIQAYRLFSTDVLIRMPDDLHEDFPIVRGAVHEYSAEELLLPEAERIARLREAGFSIHAVPLGSHPALFERPAFDPDQIGPPMSEFLARGETVPREQDLLIKAAEELKINRNCRYALLLAFIAAEQAITGFLRNVKTRRGVAPNKLRQYEADIGISYLMNVELPMVLYPDERIQEVLPDLNGVNTIRNGVVHKIRDVNYAEAASAINTVGKLLQLLP